MNSRSELRADVPAAPSRSACQHQTNAATRGHSIGRADLRGQATAASESSVRQRPTDVDKTRLNARPDMRSQVPPAGKLPASQSPTDSVPERRPSSSRDLRSDVVTASTPPARQSPSAPSDAAELDAEIVRLSAENDRLRQLLEEDGGGPWAPALFAELERESHEQQRIRCLKQELCMALQRHRRLEQAVRAGHAGLERALYGALAQSAASPHALEQALVDGAAAAEAELAEEAMLLDAETAPKPPGRRASPSPARTPSAGGAAGPVGKATSSRRRWEATDIYELEQAAFTAASSLMEFGAASRETWASQIATRLQAESWQLLRAHELASANADPAASAAAIRRRLWRSLSGRPGALAQSTFSPDARLERQKPTPLATAAAFLHRYVSKSFSLNSESDQPQLLCSGSRSTTAAFSSCHAGHAGGIFQLAILRLSIRHGQIISSPRARSHSS